MDKKGTDIIPDKYVCQDLKSKRKQVLYMYICIYIYIYIYIKNGWIKQKDNSSTLL